MSHFNPNQHFDVESWREQKIAQRTKDALAARDAAFAEKVRRDTLAGAGAVSGPVCPHPAPQPSTL